MHHELKTCTGIPSLVKFKNVRPNEGVWAERSRGENDGLILGICLEGTSRLGMLSFDLLFTYPMIL